VAKAIATANKTSIGVSPLATGKASAVQPFSGCIALLRGCERVRGKDGIYGASGPDFPQQLGKSEGSASDNFR